MRTSAQASAAIFKARNLSNILVVWANLLLLSVQCVPDKIFFPMEHSKAELTAAVDVADIVGARQFHPADTVPNDKLSKNPASSMWPYISSKATEIQIVWSDAIDIVNVYNAIKFSSNMTTRFNHIPGSEYLTSDRLMRENIVRMQKQFGKALFLNIPKYYILPHEHEEALQEMRLLKKKYMYDEGIHKDPFLHQRFVLRSVPKSTAEIDRQTIGQVVMTEVDLDHYMKRSSEEALELKQYVEPVLLEGHTFRVGYFVVISCLEPLRIYSYKHPLIKIAKVKYPKRLTSTSEQASYNFDQYFSPWDFEPLKKYFVEIPSLRSEGSNAWKIVKDRLKSYGIDTDFMEEEIENTIVKSIGSVIASWKESVHDIELRNFGESTSSETLKDNFFELLKFEFEIDYMGQPWLIQVHTNPIISPENSILSTDKALKYNLMSDLYKLLGATDTAGMSYDVFMTLPHNGKYCVGQCKDKNQIWDKACWNCPSWFEPRVIRALHATALEYECRGRFNRIFPSTTRKTLPMMEAVASELDLLIVRYVKSLSNVYSKHKTEFNDRKMMCVYREHCNGHGDCVNMQCRCDKEYEGNTCYIPKDP